MAWGGAAAAWVAPSGLLVLLAPMPEAPEVATVERLPVGAASDGAHPGLHHLVEHLAFRGDPAAQGMSAQDALAARGVDANAWTGRESMAFTTAADPPALPLSLWFHAVRGVDPALGAADLAREGRIITQERAGRPWAALRTEQLRAALLPDGHPLRADILGDGEAIGAWAPAVVQAAGVGLRGGPGAVLVVAGPVDAAAVEAAWRAGTGEALRPVALGPVLPAAPPGGVLARGTGAAVDLGPAETGHHLLWETVPAGHPAAPAFDLLAQALAARLPARWEARATAESHAAGGFFAVSVGRPPRAGGRVARRVRRALEAEARAPTPGAAALSALLHGYARRIASPAGRAEVLADCGAAGHAVDCFDRAADGWARVDGPALSAAAAALAAAPPVVGAATPGRRR
jgi:zinc protease